ncbi:hypothetical protein QBE52_03115 [Clostridiaceae bacterium 35-E11]
MRCDSIKLRDHLFKQEKEAFLQEAMFMLEDMGKRLNDLTEKEILEYNSFIKILGEYLSNGDYLTVSDILKYELIPLFEKKEF